MLTKGYLTSLGITYYVILNVNLYAFYEQIQEKSQLITTQFVNCVQNDVRDDVMLDVK